MGNGLQVGSLVGLPIGMEFSLMPTDMVRKPQLKAVMGRRDMKVASEEVHLGKRAHSVASEKLMEEGKS